MKALFYTGTRQSEIRETANPTSANGAVVVDISHCGICGSDMHAWHGHDPRRVPPLILGHEAVGIAQSGKHAGKRVALNPLMACGDCDACSTGNEHLCANRELIGMRLPGAYAEKVAINQNNLYPIPDHLTFSEAALAEPLACCVHAVKLAMDRLRMEPPKATAIVLGGGAIGLLSALVFREQDIGTIWIGETNPVRHKMLQNLGGIRVYNPIDSSSGAPSQADIVLDAVGTGKTRNAASALAKPGGTIVHIGLQDSTEGLDTRRLTLQEIAFLGTYCYRNSDFQEALDLLADGRINGVGWTEIRPLDEGARSFIDIHEGKAPPKIILEM
jgi:threonine dehydrogenase-like Zn-dependent dehydrogenase